MTALPSTPMRVTVQNGNRRPVSLRLINGTLIDNVRRNAELTVEEYALTCGIPFKTMKRICGGKNPPNGEHLLRLLRLGGVSPKLLELDGWRRRA